MDLGFLQIVHGTVPVVRCYPIVDSEIELVLAKVHSLGTRAIREHFTVVIRAPMYIPLHVAACPACGHWQHELS